MSAIIFWKFCRQVHHMDHQKVNQSISLGDWPEVSTNIACCHPSSPDEAHSSRDCGSKAHRHEPQINAFRRDPDGHWHEPSSHPSLFHLTGCLDEAIFDWIHEVLLLIINLGCLFAALSARRWGWGRGLLFSYGPTLFPFVAKLKLTIQYFEFWMSNSKLLTSRNSRFFASMIPKNREPYEQ